MNIFKSLSVLLLSLFSHSCTTKSDYNPDSHLSVKEKDNVLVLIIRYIGKAPENVNTTEIFDSKYDAHYLDIASRHRFDQYYIDDKGIHYFLISRPAPSLYEKRVAIGGKLKLKEQGELVEYEEVFRTWKMVPDTLKKRSLFLFDKMVKGESLDLYLTVNSKGVEYIEFPDEHNYYDKATRRWLQK